jgi:hypothetical protein
VADFNGDGIPDLAVANLDSNNVSVLLGNGDGTFQTARNFSAGSGPFSVAVGDFTGNGVSDLAVANAGSDTVSVLLGNGNGTFQTARSFSTGGAGPRSVAVGDFNGDGFLDLVVAGYGVYCNDFGDCHNFDETVRVLLGNGDGTFQAARSFAAGPTPRSVAVGEFDGDGRLDLAVANYGSNTVSVLLGNGDGTFQAARSFATGSGPNSVAAGDFNGDGLLDLAVANNGHYGQNSTVSVLLSNGDGSFQAARNFNAGTAPSSAAVADFNGDGIPDLAVANQASDNVSVLLGNGDGSFQTSRNFPTGPGPRSVAVGDFNGDGRLDLAVANAGTYPTYQGSVSVLVGNGDGSFQTAPTLAAGDRPGSVAVGDFDGDGTPDIAVANRASSNVSVLLGNGDGSFQTARAFFAGSEPGSVAVGDFNGDGLLDLVVTNIFGNTVSVLLGNGDGSFQAPRTFSAGSEPLTVAVGDFNGDGIPDLAVANYNYPNRGAVSVLLGNGDGTFQAPRAFSAGANPWFVAVADFNGDGLLDLAVANFDPLGSGTVSVLLGNGDGTFQAARNFPVGDKPTSVVVGDFNGDGIPDLAVANYALSGTPSVSVLLGNGNGTFQTARNFAAGSYPYSVAMGDFNGDGIPDLAVAGVGGVRVLLGNGDGSFQTTGFSYLTGSYPISVAVADFNGDGFPDLAVANNGSNDVSILLNDGNWPLRPGKAPGPGVRRPANSPAVDYWSLAAAAATNFAKRPPNWTAASESTFNEPLP